MIYQMILINANNLIKGF